MPSSFARRLDVVQPSVTLAMNAKAADLRAKGVVSKYTPVSGIPALKQAICARTAEVRGWSPKPSQVTVTVGAKHALFNLALALYEPGDEVVIPAPYWVSYPEQVKLCGATPVFVETTEAAGFKMSAQAFEKALSPRTKAV